MRERSLRRPVGWEAEAAGSTAAAGAWLLAGLRAGNLLTSPGFGFGTCQTWRGEKKKSVLHRTVRES